MKSRYSASHHRAKAMIKACVESGAGIDYIEDAPRFRYQPPAVKALYQGPPSPRGNVKVRCSRRNCACHGKTSNFRHDLAQGSLAPMYGSMIYLTDTPHEEHAAKARWAEGNPEPLRKLLAERAERRAEVELREAA